MKIGQNYKDFHVVIILPDGLQHDLWLDEENYNYLISLPRPNNTRIFTTERRLTAFVERESSDSLVDLFNEDSWL